MDRRAQIDELDSLINIYNSDEFQITENTHENFSEIKAVFWAYVTVSDGYTVKYLKTLDLCEPSLIKIKHLPAIELQLTLPHDYPSTNPPRFRLTCQWLHKRKLTELCEKLDEIWSNSGPAEIIYLWSDFLKNDSLKCLGYENELDVTELCAVHLGHVNKQRKWALKVWKMIKINELNSTKKDITAENETQDREPESGLSGHDTLVNLKEMNHEMQGDEEQYENTNNSPNGGENTEKEATSKFFFDMKRPLDQRARLTLPLNISPITVIQNFNDEKDQVEFSRNYYNCNICFSRNLGKNCTKFKNCDHVFCCECSRRYFTAKIIDQSLLEIKCPEEKCTTEALPSQIKQIVSPEIFAKYDSLLLKSALDTMKDITYCPRQICQYPVTLELGETLAVCPNCQNVFCVHCKMAYHGVEPCRYTHSEIKQIWETYEKGSRKVKAELEKKYGKKQLENFKNNI